MFLILSRMIHQCTLFQENFPHKLSQKSNHLGWTNQLPVEKIKLFNQDPEKIYILYHINIYLVWVFSVTVTLQDPLLSYCGVVRFINVFVGRFGKRCYKTCGFGVVRKYMRVLCILGICVCVYSVCPLPGLWLSHHCSDDFICAQTLQIFGEELLALTDSREKRVTSSKQITHTLPSHKLILTLQGHSGTHMKNKHRFLWASVDKIALFFCWNGTPIQ